MARPTKYKPEYPEQAAKLCKLGATDAQLADFFGVSVSTINLWKVEHDEFSESIKVPKAQADDRVEQSLFRRAMGYEHDEVDIRVVDHAIVQTPTRKYYPPDTTAAIFWLKNRRGQDWRDVKEVKLTGDLKEMTDEELLAIASGGGDSSQAAGPVKPNGLH
jgi:DNA-binding XRE family transcriptional regulator